MEMAGCEKVKSIYDRTEKLIGREKLDKLKSSKVIVFGLGGVGGYVVEAFARTGVGHISIVDYDQVDVTNMNRQIIALKSTLGEYKADAFRSRIADINEDIQVCTFTEKLTSENIEDFALSEYDYIIDAIDDTLAKIVLIEKAKALNIPIISSMGTGNKINASKFKISDISKTHTCPLAKKIRKELGLRGIKQVKVLFSEELPEQFGDHSGPPASIAFVPAVAGLLIAGEAIRDLLSE